MDRNYLRAMLVAIALLTAMLLPTAAAACTYTSFGSNTLDETGNLTGLGDPSIVGTTIDRINETFLVGIDGGTEEENVCNDIDDPGVVNITAGLRNNQYITEAYFTCLDEDVEGPYGDPDEDR